MNTSTDPAGQGRPNPARVTHIRSQAVRRPARGRTSTAGKIASASLATVTCVGLAGVLAVRAAQDSAAAESTAVQDVQAATSTGLTQADLDAYAQQLDAEAQRLADYREQLVQVAAELQAYADGQGVKVTSSSGSTASNRGSAGTTTRKPKPKPRPAAQPPKSPAQGQSQGS